MSGLSTVMAFWTKNRDEKKEKKRWTWAAHGVYGYVTPCGRGPKYGDVGYRCHQCPTNRHKSLPNPSDQSCTIDCVRQRGQSTLGANVK